jgi:hypothetical protein
LAGYLYHWKEESLCIYSCDFCFITVLSLCWSWLSQLVSSAQSEELQRMHIQKLQSDVTNLLKFVRRVREENSWDATGLTFNEVTYEDIFGTEDMTSE